MMPPVGVLIPMYLFYKNMGLLDTHLGLILIYTLINLPIVIWVLYLFQGYSTGNFGSSPDGM